MIKIITNGFFVGFVLPLITTGLSVLFKMISRNDRHSSFKKEDLAIGIETSITALLLLATDTVTKLGKFNTATQNQTSNAYRQTMDSLAVANPKQFVNEHYKMMAVSENLQTAPLLIVAVGVGLVSITFVIRKLGWKAAEEMTLFWGILFPNAFGLMILLIVVLWIR